MNHGCNPAAEGLCNLARGVFSHRCRLLGCGSRNGLGDRRGSRKPPKNKLGGCRRSREFHAVASHYPALSTIIEVFSLAMSCNQGQHGTYSIKFTIPGLQEPERSLLAQAECHVEGETVDFLLLRRPEDDDEQFKSLANRWIARELCRVNVLTGKLLKAKDLCTEPSLGVVIRVPTGWDHQVQVPHSHRGWSDESAEFRIGAWDVARHSNDPVLRFVMLDTICESACVTQAWMNKDRMPPRFAEIRLIRNLLVHGSEKPNEDVARYLCLYNPSIPNYRFSNREDHLNLARMRSAHLLSAVWQIVINDIVDIEHNLRENEPASQGGIFLISHGPFPNASDAI